MNTSIINRTKSNGRKSNKWHNNKLRVDSGCKNILLSEAIYQHIKDTTKLAKKEIRLNPYGTTTYLKVKEKAKVTMQAPQGLSIEAFVHIIKGHQVEPSLGLGDSVVLGLLQINPEGSEVHSAEAKTSKNTHILATTAKIISDYISYALLLGIGKFENPEVNFIISGQVKLVIQQEQSIPLTYGVIKTCVTSENVTFEAHSRVLSI